MIRHDYKLVKFNPRKAGGKFQPALLCLVTKFVNLHYTINDVTKVANPIAGYNSNKVHTLLAIIVPLQPHGMTMM